MADNSFDLNYMDVKEWHSDGTDWVFDSTTFTPDLGNITITPIEYTWWPPYPWPYWYGPYCTPPPPTKFPHRCPVCCGRGKVDSSFYERSGSTTAISEVTCRTCGGTGIVWSN